MIGDLVQRLREHTRCGSWCDDRHGYLLDDAADAIERVLRYALSNVGEPWSDHTLDLLEDHGDE